MTDQIWLTCSHEPEGTAINVSSIPMAVRYTRPNALRHAAFWLY